MLNYLLAQLMAIALNFNWILTSLSMLLNTAGFLYLLTIQMPSVIEEPIVWISLIQILLLYINYVQDSTMRHEFLKLGTIRQMSTDLKNLLLNLPQPILLVEKGSESTVLANK